MAEANKQQHASGELVPEQEACVRSWEELPQDALLLILGRLNAVDLAKAACACKHWHRAVSAATGLWSKLLRTEFGLTRTPSFAPSPRSVFRQCTEEPLGAHLSYLARFHAIMSHVDRHGGWWMEVKQWGREGSSDAHAADAGAAGGAQSSHSSKPGHPHNLSKEEGCSSCTGRSHRAGHGQEVLRHSLRLQPLWEQRNHQSFWVKFELPAWVNDVEPATQQQADAPLWNELTLCAGYGQGEGQVLQPIHCPRFTRPSSEEDMLLQSHIDGLYAWTDEDTGALVVVAYVHLEALLPLALNAPDLQEQMEQALWLPRCPQGVPPLGQRAIVAPPPPALYSAGATHRVISPWNPSVDQKEEFQQDPRQCRLPEGCQVRLYLDVCRLEAPEERQSWVVGFRHCAPAGSAQHQPQQLVTAECAGLTGGLVQDSGKEWGAGQGHQQQVQKGVLRQGQEAGGSQGGEGVDPDVSEQRAFQQGLLEPCYLRSGCSIFEQCPGDVWQLPSDAELAELGATLADALLLSTSEAAGPWRAEVQSLLQLQGLGLQGSCSTAPSANMQQPSSLTSAQLIAADGAAAAALAAHRGPVRVKEWEEEGQMLLARSAAAAADWLASGQGLEAGGTGSTAVQDSQHQSCSPLHVLGEALETEGMLDFSLHLHRGQGLPRTLAPGSLLLGRCGVETWSSSDADDITGAEVVRHSAHFLVDGVQQGLESNVICLGLRSPGDLAAVGLAISRDAGSALWHTQELC